MKPDDLLLLKGSRGVKMEKILEAIDASHARSTAQADAEHAGDAAEGPTLDALLSILYAAAAAFERAQRFPYITVRTAMASLTALAPSLLSGPWVIERLRELQVKQYIRERGLRPIRRRPARQRWAAF